MDNYRLKLSSCKVLRLHPDQQGVEYIDRENNDQLMSIMTEFIAKIPEINCTIGIVLKQRHSIVPVILSIIKSGHAFCCLPWHPDEATILEFSPALLYIVSDYYVQLPSVSLLAQPVSLGVTLMLYQVNGNSVKTPPIPFLYLVRTSGSTGQPKVVRVPKQCISSNVQRLTDILRITKDDVILNCSPATFDPFVVDVLLSTSTGAGLLILDDFARDFHSRTFELFTQKGAGGAGVTVLQVTPSVFKGLSRDKMIFLFSAQSSLRVICFGGESFPSTLIDSLSIADNGLQSKEVYNLYGLTEISCWSSIRKWEKCLSRTDLGDPIDDEVFEVRNEKGEVTSAGEGELWIGSKLRKCWIDEEDEDPGLGFLFRSTGDLVERIGDRFYYKGRLNGVVKRFGVKVVLSDVEQEVLMRSDLNVQNVCCLFYEERILLFYASSVDMDDQLMGHFKSKSILVTPDEFIRVPTLPMSSHGKVSKEQLLTMYSAKKHVKVDSSLSEMLTAFDLDRSFLANGGTSIEALEIFNRTTVTYPNLIELLLNPEVSLNDLLKTVKICVSNSVRSENSSLESPALGNLHWKYDLKKCVDASATVFEHPVMGTCVVVGSHSHQLVVLSVAQGNVIAELTLPDRIESKVIVQGGMLLVGCYDGFFYCLDFVESKSILWRFNAQGMIKSEAVVEGDLLIFGNYAEQANLFGLHWKTGELVWSRRVGSKGILSRPVVWPSGDVFGIATLDGTIEVIETKAGERVFGHKLSSPVFTNPILIEGHLIVSEVTGLIHGFSSKLDLLWTFKLGGNIFSSFEVERGLNLWNVYLGCYDNCLYKLSLKANKDSLQCTVVWRTELNESVYAKPVLIVGEETIICCTTQGSIISCNTTDGRITGRDQLPGHIFSSPVAVHNNGQRQIIFGSRENFLYCYYL